MHACMYHYVFVYTCKSPHGDPMNKIKDWISCLKLFQQVIKILGGNICAETFASVYLYYLHIQKEKCMYIGQCKCTCMYTTKDPHRIKMCILVGGWATPLKNMSSSIGMIKEIPNISGKIKN